MLRDVHGVAEVVPQEDRPKGKSKDKNKKKGKHEREENARIAIQLVPFMSDDPRAVDQGRGLTEGYTTELLYDPVEAGFNIRPNAAGVLPIYCELIPRYT